MHIPDGFLTPEICVLMYVISIAILAFCWKRVKAIYPRSFVPIIAVSSAFVFAAQMLNFPIIYGTSGHLVGGTFLAILLGPYASVLSMTTVLLMQAVFFADGGLSTFGANIFNMAIIGGFSFYVIKLLSDGGMSQRRFLVGVFVASWSSVVLGALACALEIGVSPMFASAGGVFITSMLFWHVIIGAGEAVITTALISQLYRIQPGVLSGVAILKGEI